MQERGFGRGTLGCQEAGSKAPCLVSRVGPSPSDLSPKEESHRSQGESRSSCVCRAALKHIRGSPEKQDPDQMGQEEQCSRCASRAGNRPAERATQTEAEWACKGPNSPAQLGKRGRDLGLWPESQDLSPPHPAVLRLWKTGRLPVSGGRDGPFALLTLGLPKDSETASVCGGPQPT